MDCSNVEVFSGHKLPSYGADGSNKAEFCSGHKKVAMMDVLKSKKRCFNHGCNKQPSYGVGGSSKVEFCACHSTPEMTRTRPRQPSESQDSRSLRLGGRGQDCAGADATAVTISPMVGIKRKRRVPLPRPSTCSSSCARSQQPSGKRPRGP